MKAQMKAVMASAVVIVLALAAVSGVTYSWFSDSEQANIDISTGTLDVTLSEFEAVDDQGNPLTVNNNRVSLTAPTMGVHSQSTKVTLYYPAHVEISAIRKSFGTPLPSVGLCR